MSKVQVDLINKYYSREAGRWCDECQQFGSHHTDKHSFYVEGSLHLEEGSKFHSWSMPGVKLDS